MSVGQNWKLHREGLKEALQRSHHRSCILHLKGQKEMLENDMWFNKVCLGLVGIPVFMFLLILYTSLNDFTFSISFCMWVCGVILCLAFSIVIIKENKKYKKKVDEIEDDILIKELCYVE